MLTSSKVNIQIVVELCVRLGLKHVVVSPGSRNAPLIIAFNQHPAINCIVIPDERSAAFFAIGMAQGLKKDELVGVLCTSGSAPLNYYPAIAEAYYQAIPLVVFTADRPQVWVNQGDGQTIVQHEVFKNHINYSVTLDDSIESETYKWYIEREVSTAFHFANGKKNGPVHLNIGHSEPLYGTVNRNPDLQIKPIFFELPLKTLTLSQLEYISDSWVKYEKKIVICGQQSLDAKLAYQLELLSNDPSVAILTENISNLTHSNFINCIDSVLNSVEKNEFYKPDLIVYIGGAIVSKKIKSFLRTAKVTVHWKIGEQFNEMDTFQSLTHSFDVPAIQLIQALNKLEYNPISNFGLKWRQTNLMIEEKISNYFVNKATYSDLQVFHSLLDWIPEHSNLHLANSSVIRYSLLFKPIQSITYFCNRGTSGIDGSTSTAAGVSIVSEDKWNTLITGDMSFFYDSNAFWNHVLKGNFRVLLINNGGGSIFKIIPGPDSVEEQNDFFVYPNNFSAEYICKAFDVQYFKAKSISDIDEQMPQFYTYEPDQRPKLMEIFTNDALNEIILKEYFSFIRLENI